MGDTSETNSKVLSQELFLGVVALKTQKNHYLRDMGPFPRHCHKYENLYITEMMFISNFGSLNLDLETSQEDDL